MDTEDELSVTNRKSWAGETEHGGILFSHLSWRSLEPGCPQAKEEEEGTHLSSASCESQVGQSSAFLFPYLGPSQQPKVPGARMTLLCPVPWPPGKLPSLQQGILTGINVSNDVSMLRENTGVSKRNNSPWDAWRTKPRGPLSPESQV